LIDLAVARGLHVLAVVLWIGGVAMSSSVLLPALARRQEGARIFQQLELRFASQARWTMAIAGLSGVYLVWRLDFWARFADARFWWMHAMVALWLLYALALFVLEPLVLRRRFAERVERDPAAALARMRRHHWVVLALSLATVYAAAAGSHGLL